MKTCPACHQSIEEKRSVQQNKYYWKCMSIIGDHLGYRPIEISTLIKDHFNWYTVVVNKQTGESLKAYESSAEWSKHQFAINTEMIIQFAGEYGITILSPEEFYNQN